MAQSQLPTTPNLSTRLRTLAASALARAGHFLYRLGVHPDTITWLGLGVTAVAALFAAVGQFSTAGVILLLGAPLDALDGAVARAMGRTDAFGGVLDSTVDRYADQFMLLGIAYFFAVQDRFPEMLLAFAAVIGTTLVSYIRARAGHAGLPCAGGVFSRLERYIVLVVALLTGWIAPGLAVLAVGANLTALHRLWSVYRFAKIDQEDN